MKGANLDLKRAVVEGDNYGPSDEWTDKVECVPLALAALIVMFVEDEHNGPEKLQEHIDWRMKDCVESSDEFGKGSHQMWIAAEEQILQLYNWWIKDRPRLVKREAELLHAWSEAKHGKEMLEPGELDFAQDLERRLNAPDTPRSRELFEAHTDIKERIRAEMQEFCHGVIEVRDFLWT
jgi:hypothetical protein